MGTEFTKPPPIWANSSIWRKSNPISQHGPKAAGSRGISDATAPLFRRHTIWSINSSIATANQQVLWNQSNQHYRVSEELFHAQSADWYEMMFGESRSATQQTVFTSTLLLQMHFWEARVATPKTELAAKMRRLVHLFRYRSQDRSS